MNNSIVIKGAKENNLKNVDLVIPRNKVVCFVGVSGSGKSTIAFDIIAREGERQYFESLPSYARRYLAKSNRPNVEEIKGVSASIIISQDRVRGNPRSTVGTLTEAYTYLRLLYSRVGLPSMDSSYYSFNHPYGACKKCKGLGRSIEVNISKLLDMNKSLNEGAIKLSDFRAGGMRWSIIRESDYFDMDMPLNEYSKELLDKLLYSPRHVVEDKSSYRVIKWTFAGVVTHMTERDTKVHRGPTESDLQYFDFIDCSECHGGRLNAQALAVRLNGKNIGEVANLPLEECLSFVKSITNKNAQVIKPRLEEQLQNLINVGIGYLSLNRSADTLSGGEAQRVKMARQLGCDLIETVYVLDEPTAGLHPRNVDKVISNLKKLRDSGNSVLVVEHDETVIRSADYLLELGPGGGKNGGEVVAKGTLKEILNNKNSLTAKYLRKNKLCHSRSNREPINNYCIDPLVKPEDDRLGSPTAFLKINNANKHNLKNLTVDIPTGVLVALTGVSGSGKSSLVEEIVSQHGDKVLVVDQGAIGATKRGCIGTYVGVFDQIRKIFAQENSMNAGLFSFNSYGACEQCKGVGFLEMDMNFLGDVKIKCDSCNGLRYKQKVLRYLYKGKNIAEVLTMTANEVKDFFEDEEIEKAMEMLIDVGLDYVEIGQTLDTLSGGEAQRLKLASRLQAKGDFVCLQKRSDSEFLILDEPTSGLYFADIEKLLKLLNRLVDNGNTVMIVEHNLDVIRNSDWIIDLGPEGGENGGEIVVQGRLQDIIKCKRSYTGKYLKNYLLN